MSFALSDSAILRHVARQPKKTASHKQLLRELGVKGEARRELTDRLLALVRKGELLQIDSERYTIPPAAKGRNLLVGRLTMHRDGYGFVIPDATSLDPDLKARLAGDVFIPPHATGSSMHGDRVLVEVSAVRPDGRAEGRILRSLARAHPTVVGIFHYGRHNNYVKPIDEKVTQEVVIPPGMENPPSPGTSASPGVKISPAAAQTPALRASVTVTGDVVRIGDLIDNAGAVAEVPIEKMCSRPPEVPLGKVTLVSVLPGLTGSAA